MCIGLSFCCTLNLAQSLALQNLTQNPLEVCANLTFYHLQSIPILKPHLIDAVKKLLQSLMNTFILSNKMIDYISNKDFMSCYFAVFPIHTNFMSVSVEKQVNISDTNFLSGSIL